MFLVMYMYDMNLGLFLGCFIMVLSSFDLKNGVYFSWPLSHLGDGLITQVMAKVTEC